MSSRGASESNSSSPILPQISLNTAKHVLDAWTWPCNGSSDCVVAYINSSFCSLNRCFRVCIMHHAMHHALCKQSSSVLRQFTARLAAPSFWKWLHASAHDHGAHPSHLITPGLISCSELRATRKTRFRPLSEIWHSHVAGSSVSSVIA